MMRLVFSDDVDRHHQYSRWAGGTIAARLSGSDELLHDDLGISMIYPNVRGSTGYGKTYLNLDNGVKRDDSVRTSVRCWTRSKRSPIWTQAASW
jgi:hypothetical protein